MDDMAGRLFVRMAGEGFDADLLEWRCEDCGLDEWRCDCDTEREDTPDETDSSNRRSG